MLLLIDADQNPDTGWQGYDYLINGSVLNDRTTTLKRFVRNATGGAWEQVARLDLRVAGKALELAVRASGWVWPATRSPLIFIGATIPSS